MRSGKRERFLNLILMALGIGFLLIFVLFPVYWMVVSSFKYPSEVQSLNPTLLPTRVRWENYVDIWKTIPLAKYFKNSIIVAGFTMIFSTMVSTCAGYALSSFRFRGRKPIGLMFLVTQMFPGILFLLPYYLICILIKQNLNIVLIGTYPGLILTYTAFVTPFSIWIMKGYFATIPTELREAALIDGCTLFSSFIKVILPVAIPGIATVAILSFMQGWNEVLFATVLTSAETRTLPLGLHEFQQEFTTSWNLIMAAGVVMTIPVLAFFTHIQKYLVTGFTSGAVKG